MRKSLLLTLLILTSQLTFAQKQKEFHLNQSYPIESNGTIYLDSDDAEVTITGEDRTDVHVKIDYLVRNKGIEWGNREFTVEVSPKSGDLNIKELRSGNTTIMGYVSTEYKIEISAPNGVSLEIDGDDDNYLITSINGEISVTADDADVVLRGCAGTHFFFDLDDGTIDMDQAAGTLVARLDDGDLEVRNATLESIDFRGDDGNVGLETSMGPSSMFKFTGDDTSYDLVITQGGGTFSINHDDGRIDYDSNFRLMDKSESHTNLALSTSGRGKVVIAGDDITVNLSSTQSN